MKSTNIQLSDGNIFASVTFTEDDGSIRQITLNVEDLDHTDKDVSDKIVQKAYAQLTEVVLNPALLNLKRDEKALEIIEPKQDANGKLLDTILDSDVNSKEIQPKV